MTTLLQDGIYKIFQGLLDFKQGPVRLYQVRYTSPCEQASGSGM